MKILLVEDDSATGRHIVKGLMSQGHTVEWLQDGRDAMAAGLDRSHDVLVVDRMIPGLSGLELVKSLRSASVRVPILFLSALSGVDDRVEGLEAGADDYLIKPFAFSELIARLDALARRPPISNVKNKLSVGDIQMDLVARTVTRSGQRVTLLPREFSLLEMLMRNEGRVITKTMFLEKVWGFNFDPQSSIIETHISRLRAKIDKPFAQSMLHTVKNVGYVLDASR